MRQPERTDAVTDHTSRSDAEWRATLTPEQYHVLREAGTERAFTGKYDKHFEAGEYTCAGCGQALFDSDAKYNSGCGWPAFTTPAQGEAVEERRDTSHGMIRTEVLCSNCGGHLGHVFPDGPRDQGGLRYCINSAALNFAPEDEK
jgi:peptide-methionine (R)-S-oxide reductase